MNARTKPHLNIGTIGHVDHGKTTLTAAITKVEVGHIHTPPLLILPCIHVHTHTHIHTHSHYLKLMNTNACAKRSHTRVYTVTQTHIHTLVYAHTHRSRQRVRLVVGEWTPASALLACCLSCPGELLNQQIYIVMCKMVTGIHEGVARQNRHNTSLDNGW